MHIIYHWIFNLTCLGNGQGDKTKYGIVRPKYYIAYTNSELRISCASFGSKIWYKDGFPDQTHVHETNIHITDIQEHHIGYYTCEGSFPNGQTFCATSTILVGGNKNQ